MGEADLRRPTLAEQLAIMKKVRVQKDSASHLRRHPLNQGMGMNLTTTYNRTVQLPVQMANDAKWSTDLKAMDKKLASRLLYQRRLTASTPGAMIPETTHFPKSY